MTLYALRELIKVICIEAPDKSSGKRRQGIRGRSDETGSGMTEAMPFLQKAILLSYDPPIPVGRSMKGLLRQNSIPLRAATPRS